MVSKAAEKFSQNHPDQHEQLLQVIKEVKSEDKHVDHHHHHQAGDKQRQVWSSRMIFNRKTREDPSKD